VCILIGRFTAILHAAARFVAPALDERIADAVQTCSIQSIMGSQRSIETVQSWMVVSPIDEQGLRGAKCQMYFWKAPSDDRGWTYVGLLCRLAVEIGLDRTSMTDRPGSSVRELREQRNRIRTWML
jgi:hypothetical protein